MHFFVILLALTMTLSATNLMAQTVVIPYGSSWKYLDDGSNQGTAWQANSYSDASWKSGNGKFGYGISDAATVVSYGSNSKNKSITTYFRKTVDIADADGFSSYTINVKRDDGVVVYVNGTEVLRNNMPTGPIAYNTLAASNTNDNGLTPKSSTINASAFISGTNIISAEIHQSGITSSDIAFDLELTGKIAPPPAALKVVTWNTYYFGADKDSNGNILGPVDDQLQYENVKKTMLWLKADIFALQEVSNDVMMEQLISELPGYSFVRSAAYSYSVRPATTPQVPTKLYVVYRTSKISVKKERPLMQEFYAKILSNEVVLADYPGSSSSAAKNDDNFWYNGRLPYLVEMDVTVNGLTQPIHLVNIHATPGSTSSKDYERRKYDARILKDSLDLYHASDNLLLVGDYNDDVDQALLAGLPSPYKPFVDDVNYRVLTHDLSLTGAGTYNSGKQFRDHITTMGQQNSVYIENSISVNNEIRDYISKFYSTTSDHLPVSAQFDIVTKAESQQDVFSASIAKGGSGSTKMAKTAEIDAEAAVADVTELNKVTEIRLFPNPTDGYVVMQLPDDEAFMSYIKLSIWSVQGSKVLETGGNLHKVHQQMQESILSVPKGLYIIEVITGPNKYQLRLVKK
jgi:endonuclease/exonuclease/phosphatase family metal-dependent hydrolase